MATPAEHAAAFCNVAAPDSAHTVARKALSDALRAPGELTLLGLVRATRAEPTATFVSATGAQQC